MARFLSFLSYSLMATTASTHVGRTQMQQPIQNKNVPVSSFGYTKNIGPMSWYGMDTSANAHCATGSMQSPINIETNNISTTTVGVYLNIPSIAATEIENLGNTVEVPLVGMGNITYPAWDPKGHVYTLQNLHFHTPSEHRLDGVHRELEMHMVFKDSNGAIAVLAQLYTVDPNAPSDPLIAGVLKNIAQVTAPGSTSTTGPLDFSRMWEMWLNYQSYIYTGSLTTPPCTENVSWFVHNYQLHVDVSMYVSLKNIMGFNARVLQNQHGGENLLMGAGKALKSNGII